MSTSHRDRNDKYIATTKHYVDIAMGCLYIGLGIYMMKVPSLTERFGAGAVYIFLGLFCAYGLYRMGRGIYHVFHTTRPGRRR